MDLAATLNEAQGDAVMGACFQAPLPDSTPPKPEEWWDWAVDVNSTTLKRLHNEAQTTDAFRRLLARHRHAVLGRSYSACQRAKLKRQEGRALSLADVIALREFELRKLKAKAARQKR